jgi:DNA topoisomerase-1
VTDKAKNARVPKDREPASLTLEECKELLANAPARGRRGKKKKKTAAKDAAAKKTTKKKAAKKKTKKKKKAKTDSDNQE